MLWYIYIYIYILFFYTIRTGTGGGCGGPIDSIPTPITHIDSESGITEVF